MGVSAQSSSDYSMCGCQVKALLVVDAEASLHGSRRGVLEGEATLACVECGGIREGPAYSLGSPEDVSNGAFGSLSSISQGSPVLVHLSPGSGELERGEVVRMPVVKVGSPPFTMIALEGGQVHVASGVLGGAQYGPEGIPPGSNYVSTLRPQGSCCDLFS